MNDNSLGELVAGIIVIGLFGVFIVYIIVPAALFAAGTGFLLGSGHAVVNYFIAFKNNVKWE
jgi:hypothetical protein